MFIKAQTNGFKSNLLFTRYLYVKHEIMGIAELRLQLHQIIDSVTDKAKLEALCTLLIDTDVSGKRISIEEYTNAIDEARQQIKDGKYISVEDLEKESENW